MRTFLIALLAISVTTLTFGQEPDAEPNESPDKPMLVVNCTGHQARIADFDFTPDGKKLFTLGQDNTLQIWDAATGEHLKTARFPWKAGTRGEAVGFVQYSSKLTVAPDGKTLALMLSNRPGIGTGGYEPYLVNLETGRIKHLPGVGGGEVQHFTFSRDGDLLAAKVHHNPKDKMGKGQVCIWRGVKKADDPDVLALALWKEWQFKNPVGDIEFAPDGSKLAVSNGLPGIHVYNLKEPNAAPREIHPENKGKSSHHIEHLAWSPDGSRLAAQVQEIRQSAKLPAKVMIWTSEGLLLRTTQTHLNERPVFRNENELLMLRISHGDKNTWKDVIVEQFDLKKNSRDELVHYKVPPDESEVSRFKITADYQRLALSNRGRDVALLDLDPKAELQPLDALQARPRFALSKKAHKLAWTGNDGKKLIAGVDLRTVKPLPPDELKAENFGPLGKPGLNKRGLVDLKFGAVSFTVFASGQDWIVMTHQGYYAASPGGEKLVGWHVNNGTDKLASFYPIERFRKKLYRPDVLELVLEKGSVTEALKVANALNGGAPGNEEVANLEKLLPPVVELRVLDQSKLPAVKLKVSARASTKEQPIKALRLLVDGRPFNDPNAAVSFKDGVPKDEREWTVELPPGKHQVVVLARSADASGLSNELDIDTRLSQDKPVLHVLAIGVSKYQDKGLNLGCADKDAEAIADAFKTACKGSLFEEVRPRLLLNQEATRDDIVQAIQQLRTDPKYKVKANDLVVVFFAGHGAKEKDQFYLLSHEADVTALAKTALSGAKLRDELKEFPCQVLLMMDACHSGAFGEKGKLKSLSPATDDATRTFTDDEVGVAVMCAAMGYEKAEEGKNNGLFTEAVVAALMANKDVPFNPVNHKQYVHHLQSYVFDKVSTASGETQHPFLHLPWIVESFALRQLVAK